MSHQQGNSWSTSWSEYAQHEGEGSDEEDDLEGDSGLDVCVFMIDVSPPMFREKDGVVPVVKALSIVSSFLHRKAITSWKDLTSVCFYNSVCVMVALLHRWPDTNESKTGTLEK
jgi:hypothetical protein